MTFRWVHQGGFLTSTCQLCGHVTRERDQRSILDQQRDHDAYTCQRRRAAAVRANSPEGQAAARKYAGDNMLNRLAEQEEVATRASCVSPTMATGLGVALGRIEASETASSVTSKPPLDTPVRGASK